MAVGIVKSWVYVAGPKKRVGSVTTAAWFLIGKMKANSRVYHGDVGIANISLNVVDLKKRAGSAITGVEL